MTIETWFAIKAYNTETIYGFGTAEEVEDLRLDEGGGDGLELSVELIEQ